MSLNALLHRHLPSIWTQRGPMAWLLRPVAAFYGGLIGLRRLAYATGLFKTQRVPALVIVVGNVVAGGAGKTPLTLAMVSHLLAKGFMVGVISRGHGRETLNARAVQHGSLPQEVGDEPLLIHQSTGVPVWVANKRAEAARGLLRAHPEVQVLICDDGLQHLALARDIEICVMDERGIGNGWLLPAGPLREPWPRPVDAVLHTGTVQIGQGFRAKRQLADHALNAQGEQIPLSALLNRPLHAVAGLARPEAFFEMLRQAGLTLARTTPLPDHHNYQNWQAAEKNGTVLCTEKDAAKLWPHEPNALAVPLILTPENEFWTTLDTLVQHRINS